MDTAKAVLRGKVIVIQAYLRNKKNLKQPSLTPKGIKSQPNPHLVGFPGTWDRKWGEGSVWPVVTPRPDQSVCYTVRASSGHFPLPRMVLPFSTQTRQR